MPSLADVVDLLHAWYPPSTADSWDAVGLVAGDPAAEVARVMFAVDPTVEVAQEAVEWGADLLVVHHPLFLTPVSSVAADTPKGRTLHTLTSGGCALLAAHTNADQAGSGVSESFALALGLTDLTPIRPAPAGPLDKVVVFVPLDAVDVVRAALTDAGAGRLGDYDSCTWTSAGEGRFRPLDGASPVIGTVGDLEVVEEARVEAVVPRGRRTAVVRALLAAHPYEEPAFDVVPVCGGAGDFLLDELAHSDVDVYVTSDLRHHRAAEFLEHDGPALVDVAHWAAEWTWLPVVEARLREELGDRVETRVSTRCTDPWTFRH